MIPIIIGSVIGLAIIIEKFWSLWSIRINTARFVRGVFDRLKAGDYGGALKLCDENAKHPLAKVFLAGIEKRELPPAELEKVLERLGLLEINDLERYLGGLISVIGIEPLLGFLGTITGLIKAFMAWEQAGPDITVSVLAQGIYEAMITTAAGLIIAVPFYLTNNYIVSRIKRISQELSNYSMELTELISEIRRTDAKTARRI